MSNIKDELKEFGVNQDATIDEYVQRAIAMTSSYSAEEIQILKKSDSYIYESIKYYFDYIYLIGALDGSQLELRKQLSKLSSELKKDIL